MANRIFPPPTPYGICYGSLLMINNIKTISCNSGTGWESIMRESEKKDHIKMMDSDFSSANKPRPLPRYDHGFPIWHILVSLALFFGLARDREKFEFYANDVSHSFIVTENFSIQNYDTSSWPHQITLSFVMTIKKTSMGITSSFYDSRSNFLFWHVFFYCSGQLQTMWKWSSRWRQKT